jgi:hypothetical protein
MKKHTTVCGQNSKKWSFSAYSTHVKDENRKTTAVIIFAMLFHNLCVSLIIF